LVCNLSWCAHLGKFADLDLHVYSKLGGEILERTNCSLSLSEGRSSLLQNIRSCRSSILSAAAGASRTAPGTADSDVIAIFFAVGFLGARSLSLWKLTHGDTDTRFFPCQEF
jgi:hypothetical protein